MQNSVLWFAGQELIWQRTWRAFGLANDEILSHFGGPAFLAWTRMGNIHSYMGPLPQSFVCDQAGEHYVSTPQAGIKF